MKIRRLSSLKRRCATPRAITVCARCSRRGSARIRRLPTSISRLSNASIKSTIRKIFPSMSRSPVHPMQRFVTVRDDRKALTVFSYGCPEYELKLDAQRTLALTLLRCVGRLSGLDLSTCPGGDAGWKNETPGAQCPGEHVFRYAVLAHAPGAWDAVLRHGEEFHTARLAFARKHEAALPNAALFACDNPSIVLSALKAGEAGKGIVIRLYKPGKCGGLHAATFGRHPRTRVGAIR